METLKIGAWQLTWLDGGVTHLDGGAMFGVVPKPLWERKYGVNDKNQIELRTDPLLLQAGNHNILIESGIGNGKLTEKQKRNFGVLSESQIQNNLEALGLTVHDIDTILMTHLHYDHSCGLTVWDEEKQDFQSVFPNATIYASQTEWDEMRNPNMRSKNTYWEMNWKSIQHQIRTFQEEITIIEGIRMIHTGGHSDGHSIIEIINGGEMVLHLADLMATHAHQPPLWVMAYDDYPMTSIFAKEKWLQYGQKQNTWYTFYHDAYYRAIKWDDSFTITDSVKRIR